jgi:hypothetical protein
MKKPFLTAEEAEANPAIIRHPEARHKARNRAGQRAGISKTHLDFPFSWRSIEMLESVAYRVLSLSARKVLERLEIEFERHGRNPLENGHLPCTYEDLVKHGIDRHSIAPAIREAIALGFIRVTRPGSAGNAEHRQATLFLLTYRHSGSDVHLENNWRRIKTVDEAETVAKAARAGKADPRAREFGRKGALARWAKNKTPVMETALRSMMETTLKPTQNRVVEPDFPVMETAPLSIISRGAGTCSKRATPHASLPELIARLPWSPPRKLQKGFDPNLRATSDRMASIRLRLTRWPPLKPSSYRMPYQAERVSAQAGGCIERAGSGQHRHPDGKISSSRESCCSARMRPRCGSSLPAETDQ